MVQTESSTQELENKLSEIVPDGEFLNWYQMAQQFLAENKFSCFVQVNGTGF